MTPLHCLPTQSPSTSSLFSASRCPLPHPATCMCPSQNSLLLHQRAKPRCQLHRSRGAPWFGNIPQEKLQSPAERTTFHWPPRRSCSCPVPLPRYQAPCGRHVSQKYISPTAEVVTNTSHISRLHVRETIGSHSSGYL